MGATICSSSKEREKVASLICKSETPQNWKSFSSSSQKGKKKILYISSSSWWFCLYFQKVLDCLTMKLMYFLHQSLPHKLKEDALFYWQFKTKWEELTVCIFFQLCYQGNVWFISSATSISNLPSPYYLLPDVMRFGKKIFPNCSKGVRVVGRSEFTDDPILDLESTQLHTWVFSIYSIFT